MRIVELEEMALEFSIPIGSAVCSVEDASGYTIEVPECYLEALGSLVKKEAAWWKQC